MIIMRNGLWMLVAIFAVNAVWAAEITPPSKQFQPLPEPPAMPKNYRAAPSPAAQETPSSVPDLEPEVTITTQGKDRHEEYRLNSRLYMIKVIPEKGAPYYLIDHEGAGDFTRSEFSSKISIPQWVIKSF